MLVLKKNEIRFKTKLSHVNWFSFFICAYLDSTKIGSFLRKSINYSCPVHQSRKALAESLNFRTVEVVSEKQSVSDFESLFKHLTLMHLIESALYTEGYEDRIDALIVPNKIIY